jgi:hypothetical protein
MNQSAKRTLSFLVAATLLIIACGFGQSESNSEQFENLVVTSVAETLTAIPTDTPAPTDTPSPTPTEVIPAIQLTAMPTFALPTSTLADSKTDYVCNVTDQKPFDDTEFRPGDSFDIKWTIVNTGTKKWEDETHLEYQDGPEMTDKTQIELPNLKPGGKYEVVLDAIAPSEEGMQVMVWAVVGPGAADDSEYWMCYPYVRIVVK